MKKIYAAGMLLGCLVSSVYAMVECKLSRVLPFDVREAARRDNVDAVRSFLETDSEVLHMKDDRGCGLLHIAVKAGFLRVVAYLLERGADINACDVTGKSPLHYAVIGGQLDVVQFLLDHNANPILVDTLGRSPDCLAYEHPEILALLRCAKLRANAGALKEDMKSLLRRTCTPAQNERIVSVLADLSHDLREDVQKIMFGDPKPRERERIERRLSEAGLLE